MEDYENEDYKIRCYNSYGHYTDYVKNVLHNKKKVDSRFKNKYFKSYLIKYFFHKYNLFLEDQENTDLKNELKEITNLITDYLNDYIRKPQQIISYDKKTESYNALDLVTNTKYVCFKNYAVLDFDVNKNGFTTKEEIVDYLDNNEILKNTYYYRQETKNGFHVILLDKRREYNDFDNFLFLMQFKSDIYYNFFSYMRGYCIRINKRENDYKGLLFDDENKRILVGFNSNKKNNSTAINTMMLNFLFMEAENIRKEDLKDQ